MELIGTNSNGDAVQGTSSGGGAGVRGISTADNHDGVVGENGSTGNGVLGVAVNGTGVYGQTQNGSGVFGVSQQGDGLSGRSADGGAGVRGISAGTNHDGVVGQNTTTGNGVLGVATNGSGVYGQTASGDGVSGESVGGGAGVRGTSANPNHIGVVGENTAGGKAGGFFGDVLITGNLALTTGDIILANADCAEEFDVLHAGCAEPGSVMVLDKTGALAVSCCAYDRRVVGVIFRCRRLQTRHRARPAGKAKQAFSDRFARKGLLQGRR